MHGCDIQHNYVSVHPRLGIYIPTLASYLATIGALASLKHVPRKHLSKICIDKLILRLAISTEYDPASMLLGCGIG